jgi:hypothetical protein
LNAYGRDTIDNKPIISVLILFFASQKFKILPVISIVNPLINPPAMPCSECASASVGMNNSKPKNALRSIGFILELSDAIRDLKWTPEARHSNG